MEEKPLDSNELEGRCGFFREWECAHLLLSKYHISSFILKLYRESVIVMNLGRGLRWPPHFGGHNRHLSLCHRYIERKKRVRERIGHL